jgi:hypothetical protein
MMLSRGETAAPKRPCEVRCRPPRCIGLANEQYGKLKRSGFGPTGNGTPATLYPAYLEVPQPGLRGSERAVYATETVYRSCTVQRMGHGKPVYSVPVRDTPKRRIGLIYSRCLSCSAESIFVNVGGLRAEVSSPPMNHVSVGGVIVVGAWESHVHGEGHQEGDISLYPLTAIAPGTVWDEPQGAGCERERNDNAGSDPSSGMLPSGEPGAVRVARRVRRGE